MNNFSPNVHWRDSARPARLFVIDYRASFPLLLLLLHMRLWTFILALFGVIFFATLERFGFTIPVFLRWSRAVLAGKRKLSKPWWNQ